MREVWVQIDLNP